MFIDYNYVDVLVNLVLAFTMLGIGLSLTSADFKNIFLHPKPLIIALSSQLLVVPVLAFFIAFLSDLPNDIKVGIVIVSLCASGATSNLICHLFNGNVALAISMTTINSFITLFSIPLLTNLALKVFLGFTTEIQLPFWETILQIFIITIIPASIGVYIRRIKQEFALAMEKPLKIILPLLLALIFSIKIFFGESSGGNGITFHEAIEIMPYMFVLNILAMLLGFYIARLFKLSFKNQYTISIEVGLQNTAVAILIAGTILKNPAMEKPAIVYAMFSFFTAILFIVFIKKIFRKQNLQ